MDTSLKPKCFDKAHRVIVDDESSTDSHVDNDDYMRRRYEEQSGSTKLI